jgi:hypothetical protein
MSPALVLAPDLAAHPRRAMGPSSSRACAMAPSAFASRRTDTAGDEPAAQDRLSLGRSGYVEVVRDAVANRLHASCLTTDSPRDHTASGARRRVPPQPPDARALPRAGGPSRRWTARPSRRSSRTESCSRDTCARRRGENATTGEAIGRSSHRSLVWGVEWPSRRSSACSNYGAGRNAPSAWAGCGSNTAGPCSYRHLAMRPGGAGELASWLPTRCSSARARSRPRPTVIDATTGNPSPVRCHAAAVGSAIATAMPTFLGTTNAAQRASWLSHRARLHSACVD